MKVCKICGGEFSEDNFPKTVSNKGKEYTKPYCIPCNRKLNREQWHKRERVQVKLETFKVGEYTYF